MSENLDRKTNMEDKKDSSNLSNRKRQSNLSNESSRNEYGAHAKRLKKKQNQEIVVMSRSSVSSSASASPSAVKGKEDLARYDAQGGSSVLPRHLLVTEAISVCLVITVI